MDTTAEEIKGFDEPHRQLDSTDNLQEPQWDCNLFTAIMEDAVKELSFPSRRQRATDYLMQ